MCTQSPIQTGDFLRHKNTVDNEETDSNAETISGSLQKGRKDLEKNISDSHKEMWKQ